MKSESEVAQSCPTLCNPMDCTTLLCPWDFPGKSTEWVAISFPRGSSQPRDQTWVSHIVGRRFTIWATREVTLLLKYGLCLITQSCLTLCDPMDCSLPGSSVHGDSPGKNTGVSSHSFLQGIFPAQGSNPGLLHCRQILYHLSHWESPANSNISK